MTERYSFQTEAKELLELMIYSVYSNKDIFLRELISNASDALDKRRIAALKSEAPSQETPEIRIERDKGKRMLSVSDNGIGMNHDELVSYLGTIAKSGTREFIEKAKSNKEMQEAFIGQFGVGFYSSFMVAELVEVVTKRAGDTEAWRFESSGDGTYTIEGVEKDDAGTTVTLHLRDMPKEEGHEGKDYTDEWVLRDIVSKYSDFVSYPIIMKITKWEKDRSIEDEVPVNSQKAIWSRPESEVSDEEYDEFYRHVSRDWQKPLAKLCFTAEGTVNFRGLIYIPSSAPFAMIMGEKDNGIHLYIKRVFIMEDAEQLIPRYLRFVRGVIDTEDLPLNLSRELLQDDPRARVIRRGTVRKIFSFLKKLRGEDPVKYEKFWESFGVILKEGIVQDNDQRESLFELCLFRTTYSDAWTTLDDHILRMKPEQKGIYWIAGRDVKAIQASPLLESFKNRGIEVLLLCDPIDELVVGAGHKYKEKDFVSVSSEDKELPEVSKELEEKFTPLTEVMLSKLDKYVSAVKLSSRLSSSPACLVSNGDGMSFQMEQLMRAMGRGTEMQSIKRVLEINPLHPIINSLLEQKDSDKFEDFVGVLYDNALIMEGGQLQDLAAFSNRISALMELALERSK
jgi:molecular chaperone HtpG